MNARHLAYLVLRDVEEGAYANLVLADYLEKQQITGPDRGLATEIAYGTIKYRQLLDWLINSLVARPDKLEIGPRLILRLSFYQLLFMDRIPPSAATNEGVKLAKKFFNPGAAGLINGVLRGYLRDPGRVKWPSVAEDPVTYLEIVHSHPRWMVERWLARYGLEDTRRLCEFNNQPPDLWIRTNTLRINRDELIERLESEGCLTEKSSRVPEGIKLVSTSPPGRLSSFRQGLFTIQDESSMLVAHALSPEPGSRVLDVCAGPGGKTGHLAQLMDNKGIITACDVHEHRLRLIQENAARLGIDIIKVRQQDATKLVLEGEELYPFVLVDAPCSGLGVLRRRPDSRWRKCPQDIETLAGLQQEILSRALAALEPGGRLIYSTCTIEPEENSRVIDRILASHENVEPLDLGPYMSYKARGSEEERELAAGRRQYLPFLDHMEGFFIAGLTKRTS